MKRIIFIEHLPLYLLQNNTMRSLLVAPFYKGHKEHVPVTQHVCKASMYLLVCLVTKPMLVPEHRTPELHHMTAVTCFQTGVKQADSRLFMTNENRALGALLPRRDSYFYFRLAAYSDLHSTRLSQNNLSHKNPFMCGCAFELAKKRNAWPFGLTD